MLNIEMSGHLKGTHNEFLNFFHGITFLLESMTDRHIVWIWAFGRHLLKNRRSKRACHFQENKWQPKSPVIKFELLWENETLGKLLFATVSLSDF